VNDKRRKRTEREKEEQTQRKSHYTPPPNQKSTKPRRRDCIEDRERSFAAPRPISKCPAFFAASGFYSTRSFNASEQAAALMAWEGIPANAFTKGGAADRKRCCCESLLSSGGNHSERSLHCLQHPFLPVLQERGGVNRAGAFFVPRRIDSAALHPR